MHLLFIIGALGHAAMGPRMIPVLQKFVKISALKKLIYNEKNFQVVLKGKNSERSVIK